MPADVYPMGRWAAAHMAPVYMDRDATLDKIAAVAREAAAHGSRIVAFPEGFLPGFPVWCLVQRPIDQHEQFAELLTNSVRVPGPESERLSQIARSNDVFLSVGVTERSPVSVGGLYNSNLVFDAKGTLVVHHRKLVATWAERLVWSHGDGAGLRVVDTDLGRLGVLICGENTNPLARYALMAQGEQLHIATWPPAWPFTRGGDPGDYRRWIEIRAAAHAFEAKVFSLSVAAHLDEATIQGCAHGDAEVEKVLREAPPAVSLALGPGGQLMGEPIQGTEGILYADIDVSQSITAKMAHDVVCGYQRLDVFEVRLNRRRQVPIELGGDPPVAESDRAAAGSVTPEAGPAEETRSVER
jgi:nitrilase